MSPCHPHPVVHLELHTHDLPGACAFYTRLLGWRNERLAVRSGTYHALRLGGDLDGGVVECGLAHARWLPYVEVEDIAAVTDRAVRLGASLRLAPREGPSGWRSVVATARAGEVALWQPKRPSGATP